MFYSVDEKTNAVFNEFLRYDRSLDSCHFMRRSQRVGGGSVITQSRHGHRHQHHRSHHHNPLHQHRWRHRVFCTTGSPGSVVDIAPTSCGRAAVEPPVLSLTAERQHTRHSSFASQTGMAATASPPRVGSTGPAASAASTVHRQATTTSGAQLPSGNDSGPTISASLPGSESTRRRPPSLQVTVVGPSIQDSTDDQSPPSFSATDRKPSLSMPSTTQ